MTLAERIIANHANRDRVAPGELVTVAVDRVYLQDGNSPTIRKLFAENGFTEVFDPSRIGVFFDHSVLAPDIKIADRLREAEDFAEKLGLCIFKAGTGISQVVALEEGWFEPGTIVVGSDSHTCTGGALQCLALGMGASDIVAPMITGKTWLRVPETAWIETYGVPQQHTRAKDVMLYTLLKLGQKPFLYKSIEWSGNWLDTLSLDAIATIANMGVGREVLVGIFLERSLLVAAVILGILKAGGAFVALDPTYPQERLAYMLNESQASVLLTQKQFVDKLPPSGAKVVCLDSISEAIAQENEENLVSRTTSDRLAYVIFTSGQQENPKVF